MWLKILTIVFSALMIMPLSKAQLCTGSLGDPIVNTTFGAGVDVGAPLPGTNTNYQYSYADCPNDGFYTIRNSTNACFGNSWHTLSSDHTGDPHGYFMLVNASFQPSVFYLDTVKGLCPGTTYELAAWIVNMVIPSSCSGNTIRPDLTFTIEEKNGTVLRTYNTGSIAPTSSYLWVQYGSFFTTPPGITDVVLRIVNNAQGGCGNDLALDDITFRPCGPLLTASITGLTGQTVSVCEGNAATYTFKCGISGGFTNPEFQWQQRLNGGNWNDIAGETTTLLSRNYPSTAAPGIYQYRLAVAESGNMSSAQCRIVSTALEMKINPNPVVNVVNNGPICEGKKLSIAATGGLNYSWAGPNGFSSSDSIVSISNIQFGQAGKYYVTVGNAAGCSIKDSVSIVVNPVPIATTNFDDVTICIGDSVRLVAGGGTAYEWTPATSLSSSSIFNPNAAPVQTIQYSVVVANQFACSDTAIVIVNVAGKPAVNAGPDKVILTGQSISLSATVSGIGNTYSWEPSIYINDIHSLYPVVNPPKDFTYVLKAVSNFGCGTGEDSMKIKVYDQLLVPNAFSPNGDNVNDSWNIPALGAYSYFEETVYNRYGQLVFHTKNFLQPWDGRFKGDPLPAGAYTYFIRLGETGRIVKGTVLLIR